MSKPFQISEPIKKVTKYLFVPVIVTLIGMWLWSKWEEKRRSDLALERYITGKAANILTIEMFLCHDILDNKLCPTSVREIDQRSIYDIYNENARQSLNEYFSKILTYNRICSGMTNLSQEKEILFLYSEAQRLRVDITARAMMEKDYYEIVDDCRVKIKGKYPGAITTADR